MFGHPRRPSRPARNALMLSVPDVYLDLVIAVLPTDARRLTAAPVMLGLAEEVQGVSICGEYDRATYLTEVADEKTAALRGFTLTLTGSA